MDEEDAIKGDLASQVEELSWGEVQSGNSDGLILLVDIELELAAVGSELVVDRDSRIKEYIENGLIVVPSREEVKLWEQHQVRFRSIFIKPYTLIQGLA